jgi:hypothetical protein
MPLQHSPFLDRLVLFLMPYFIAVAPDRATARAEILETLAAYGARTRAELFTAAQVLAFGLSALDVLAEAKTIEEMPAATRLRYRSCANALNRTCQQNEKALAKRLACDAATDAEPTEAEFQQANTAINACRNRLSGTRPQTFKTSKKPNAIFAAFAEAAHAPP